jgi:hypothetical protein
MGLFGDDKRQDERLDALELHIRNLTEAVQKNRVDTAACWASLLGLQAQVSEKISASDVDPVLTGLNEDLGVARKLLDESAQAASESWAALQKKVDGALDSLRKNVTEAADQFKGESG